MDRQTSKVSQDVILAIGRAVDALQKWVKAKSKSEKSQLLEQDDFLYFVLTLKKIPPKGRTNPYKIPLPHPFHPFNPYAEHCLIIDDRSKSKLTSEFAKKKIQLENIPIAKVLKLSKLKSDYRPFEAKRKLCSSFDMFFADKRVIPLLPRVLGKEFFKKKKIPIPIDLNHKNWKEQIQRASESALFYLRTGTCSVLKVALVSQSREEIIANVVSAIDGVLDIVPKKWDNVRAIHLKATESLALPVYESVPTLGLKIESGSKKEEDRVGKESEVESGEEGVGAEKEKTSGKKKAAKKGRMHEVRYMDSNIGELMDNLSSDDDVNAEDELMGTKSKKVDKNVKKPVLKEANGEKTAKKSLNVKKTDGVKKKKKEQEYDDEVVGGTSDSIGLKEKKKDKIGKVDSAEVKLKKKSKKSD